MAQVPHRRKMIPPRRFMEQRESRDFISEMPDKVIGRILECMPLKDAVRTSVLSRSWRYKWTNIHELVFNDTLHSESVKDLIYEVIAVHPGPIHKFVLKLPAEFLPQNNADLGRWMRFLSRNDIKELTLDNSAAASSDGNTMELPSSMFSCLELTSLTLCDLKFKAPPAFVGFKHLIRIDFEGIKIAREAFETLVSSASQLETLRMVHCVGIEHAKINASNLKYLDLWIEFKSAAFTKMPHLVKSSLTLRETDDCFEWRNSNLIKLAELWPKLEYLTLGYSAFKVLSAGYVMESLEIKFQHLKRLELKVTAFQTLSEFACAMSLIQNSPNLQELEIKDPIIPAAVVEQINRGIPMIQGWGYKFANLRKVTMEVIFGVSAELQLIKFLLAASPVLETMSIVYDKRMHHDEKVKLLSTLLQFKRASPFAIVSCTPALNPFNSCLW